MGRTTPVGSSTRGTGPFGTRDMAGNAWEWASPTMAASTHGDYRSSATFIACSARYDVGIDDGNHGFRVIVPAP